MAAARPEGLAAEPLFVGLTRPAMALGVPYAALLVNGVLTMEAFVVTHQLLWLLAFVPIHGLLYALCRQEPRVFELLQLWALTRGLALAGGSLAWWRASTHGPLPLDLPDTRGRRRAPPRPLAL